MHKNNQTTIYSYYQKIFGLLNKNADYGLWAIGTLSIFGSLYYSEVAHLIPCLLCWWQRVLMYPIAIIMTVGILRNDKAAPLYTLPLSVIGLFISGYHSLLQWGVIKESVLNCSVQSAVSCAKADINYFGFITIPFLAFLGFAAAVILGVVRYISLRRADDSNK